jgi:2-polyprenyl-3-methyl-5-hydroxy-6-metoxy-1,4-benzoquinol methylase
MRMMTIQPSVSDRYDLDIDSAADTPHRRILRAIGSTKSVLELGCAAGAMSRALQEQGCSVIALEIDAEAASAALPYCERVIVCDLDRYDLADAAQGRDFDFIVAADVLEHLKDPARTLGQARQLLKPSGRLAISLPNVAHGAIRLALLSGSFAYTDTGLLDRTHLRFFTRESAIRLLESAGFEVDSSETIERTLDEAGVEFRRDGIPKSLVKTVMDASDARAYQFVFYCKIAGLAPPGAPRSEHLTTAHPVLQDADGLENVVLKQAAAIRELRSRLARQQEADRLIASLGAELDLVRKSRPFRFGRWLRSLQIRFLRWGRALR